MLRASGALTQKGILIKLKCCNDGRLISVEDVRNYLSHIIFILIFDFFLNFLLFVRLQTPTSSTDQLWFFVT